MLYKVGDKVRITTDKSKSSCWNSDGKMDHWLGKVMTIKSGIYVYTMIEDQEENDGNGWFWNDYMIDCLVDEYKEPEDWSDSEIQQARILTTNLLTEVIYNNGDVIFDYKSETKVGVVITKECYKIGSIVTGTGTCSTYDKFNLWIGKCVAVCHALDHPIPDFIRKKNKNRGV